MPLTAAMTERDPQSLRAALRALGEDPGPIVATRGPADNVTHARLQDGTVLVICHYGADRAVVYRPDDYAAVDLSQVRDARVAAMWDVSAPWA